MFAYLDPASGSMMLSAIAGGAAGLVVFFRSFGHRFKSTIIFWKKDDVVEASERGEADTADESADVSSVSAHADSGEVAETTT